MSLSNISECDVHQQLTRHTDNAPAVLIWANLQNHVALISICLPAVFQLAQRLVQYGPSALFSSKDYSIVERTVADRKSSSIEQDQVRFASVNKRGSPEDLQLENLESGREASSERSQSPRRVITSEL